MQRRLTCCAGRDCAVHGFRVARPLYWSDEGCCASAGCPCSRSFRRCTSRQSQVSACPLAALPNGLPPETVFLAVVDPGVGAGTRPRRTKARALMTRTNTSNIVQIDRLARFWQRRAMGPATSAKKDAITTGENAATRRSCGRRCSQAAYCWRTACPRARAFRRISARWRLRPSAPRAPPCSRREPTPPMSHHVRNSLEVDHGVKR
jgi:hypothetical protein